MDKELQPYSSLYRNPLAQGRLIGVKRGVVWMPSIKREGHLYPFKPKEIRFLHAYASGASIPEICAKLNLTEDQVKKLLKRKRSQDYLSELDEMDAEVLARTAKSRVAKEILDVWDGKTSKNKGQLEAAKELWSRVWPKPISNSQSNSDKLEVNINIGKLQEAVKRQETIEAQIVTDSIQVVNEPSNP